MHKDPDALAVVSHPTRLAQKAARAAFHQNLLLFLCAPLEVLPALVPALWSLVPALPGPVPLASAPHFPLPPLWGLFCALFSYTASSHNPRFRKPFIPTTLFPYSHTSLKTLSCDSQFLHPHSLPLQFPCRSVTQFPHPIFP